MLCFQSVQLPFADTWKYGILALSILLLLVALIILTCQLCEHQKLSKTRKEKKYVDEACNGITQENGFLGKRIQSSFLDIAQYPYYNLKNQRIQKELRKLGIVLSPASASNDNKDVPDPIQGKLRFSLLYNKNRLELLLMVTGVLGLPSQGCRNIFIQVRLLSCASSQSVGLQHIVHEWQTQVIRNCTSPTFGDQFACTLQEAELAKSSIKLEVKHFDRYSRHMPLGEVRVALNALKTFQSMEFCEELHRATKDIVGEVLVSLKCLPLSQRIEVGLLKVKTVSMYNSPEKCIYARIDVFWNLHKQRHQKSKPKILTSVTVFNETFLFHLPEPVVWDCVVLISIYKMHPSSRQLVGQAALGKRGPGERNYHWDCMMQAIQQPVAKWHPLLI
ncbi:synaptotagmin-1-like [Eublepharis macularius]|uniref:Synaptotagmin-1-like n=1 Tax=Eublepharis macularius TaxID=481883 RepID=A0AA97IUT4_EUBMA|nr:synaptotagmin-1-like [Eublepharis macularius]